MCDKTVYLFSRCSTVQQAEKGDSLERQTRATIEWIKRDYPTWVISNKTFTLAGVSGYDGSSLGLGGFLEACKRGEIVHGKSVLAVEAPDRISRAEVSKTRQLWHTLQKEHGVDIAVTRWGIVFDHGKEMDLGNDLMLTAAFHLARMESDQKSQRIRAAHNKGREESRREGGKKRTRTCPAWLELNVDRTEFLPIPEKVKLLQMLFDMKLKQDKGPDAIARELNKKGVESITGNPWSKTSIRKYLSDPKCIGIFQPQTVTKVNGKRVYKDEGSPIEDYYPAVIDKTIFYATQKTFTTSAHGRKGRFTNLFKGITACPKCGSNLDVTTTSPKDKPKRLYLKCAAKIRGSGCEAKQVPYQPLEDALVEHFQMFDYSKLIGGNEASDLQKEIDQLQVKQQALESKIDIELDNASQGNPEIRQRFIDRANNLSEELQEVREQIATLQTELLSVTNRTQSIELQIDDYDSRQQFNSFLKQYVEAINPYKKKAAVEFKDRGYSSVVPYDKSLPEDECFIFEDDN